MSGFATPLVALTPYARWEITVDDKTDVLIQLGPQIFHPVKQVLPFVEAAVRAADALAEAGMPDLPVPAGEGREPPLRERANVRTAIRLPLAVVLWAYWKEMVVPGDSLAKRWMKRFPPAFTWWLWPDAAGGCNAAFRVLDDKNQPVPLYDLDRRPLGEMAAGLSAFEDLMNLFRL